MFILCRLVLSSWKQFLGIVEVAHSFFQRSNSFRPTERFFPNSFMRNHLFYHCYHWRCVEEQFVNVNTRRVFYRCFHWRFVAEQFVNVNAWFTNSWFTNSWDRILCTRCIESEETSCVFFRRPHSSRCTNSSLLNRTTRIRRSL